MMIQDYSRWFEGKVPYLVSGGKDKGKKHEVRIWGAGDIVMLFTELNGKKYSKLIRVKPLKTIPLETVLEREVDKQCNKALEWIKKEGFKVNGADFYKHDIKSDMLYAGMTADNFFEMVLEGCKDTVCEIYRK